MKKKVKRAATFVPTYSKLQLAMSSTTEPLDAGHRRHVLTRMWDAFANLKQNPAPSPVDWVTISDCVNMMDTLIGQEWAEDPDNLLTAASDAMERAAVRKHEHGVIRLDAEGISAIHDILLSFEVCMNGLSARCMRAAHVITERAIWEQKRGHKNLNPDIKVITL